MSMLPHAGLRRIDYLVGCEREVENEKQIHDMFRLVSGPTLELVEKKSWNKLRNRV